MELLAKYNIRVGKRVLFFFAGTTWGGAGLRILTLGYKDLSHSKNVSGYLLISLVIFYLFFTFVFHKLVNKHTIRIMSSGLAKHGIFSFFDVKGYIIMFFMMTGGIIIRNSQVVNPVYLGTFYLGLGAALFLAGIMFLAAVLNFKKIKMEYRI